MALRPLRELTSLLKKPVGGLEEGEGKGKEGKEGKREGGGAVSYTHLTLPTIYSV